MLDSFFQESGRQVVDPNNREIMKKASHYFRCGPFANNNEEKTEAAAASGDQAKTVCDVCSRNKFAQTAAALSSSNVEDHEEEAEIENNNARMTGQDLPTLAPSTNPFKISKVSSSSFIQL